MLKSLVKFARIRIIVTCYALAFLGSVAVGSITAKTLLAILAIAAWYIHAASTNDFADKEIDKVNFKTAKDRPLLTKDINQKQFWAIHFTSGVAALVFASLYGFVAVIATVGMLVTDYLYSMKPFRITDRGIFSQLVLAVGYVYYPFSLGYWSVSSHGQYPWILALGLYFGFVGRILLKDFRDVKGDKLHGKMTFLLRHGVKTTCVVSGIFWLLALITMGYAITFEIGTMIPLILGFLLVVILLRALSLTKLIDDQQKLIALIAKAANISVIVLLALLLCQQQPQLSSSETSLIPGGIGLALLFLVFVRYKTLQASKI